MAPATRHSRYSTASPARNPVSRRMLNIDTPSHRVKSGARMRYVRGMLRYAEAGAEPATGSCSAGTETILAHRRTPARTSGPARDETCRSRMWRWDGTIDVNYENRRQVLTRALG